MSAPRLVLLVLAASQTSCVVNHLTKYPSEWEPLQSGSADCAHLSGVYLNALSSNYPDAEAGSPIRRSLAEFIAGATKSRETFPLGNVKLLVSGKSIQAELVKQPGYPAELLAISTSWQCTKGVLQRSTSTNHAVEDSYFYKSTERLSLHRSRSGDLVVELDATATALANILIPYGATDRFWGRFGEVR
jgi:hypothetical protein